jgi:hypothetical protein
MENIIFAQAEIPIIPEFVQYGVIGICIMLIVLVGYVIRQFLHVMLQQYSKMDVFNDSVNKLIAKLDNLTIYRRKKAEMSENNDE